MSYRTDLWKTFAGFNLWLIVGCVLCFHHAAQAGQSIALAWDPSNDPSVAGYKIYWGMTSLSYTTSIDVGNVTSTVIAVPSVNATYYFAATTYDAWGNESDFSNETTYYVPAANAAPAALISVVQADGLFGFTVSGTSGSVYVVQTSTNLLDWVSVRTNTSPFTFVDTNATRFSQCFYRSVGW